MDLSLDDTAEFVGRVLFHFTQCRQPSAPTSAPFDGVPNMLTQILKGQTTMSDAQTQQGRDTAQIMADLAIIKPAMQTMSDKIAALTAAATADAGSVSPALQAQIDELHAFAQSVAPSSVDAPSSEPVTDPAPVVPVADLISSEPTVATPPADTTASPAPTAPAPADTDTSAPTGTETPLPTT